MLPIFFFLCACAQTRRIDYTQQGNQYAQDGLLREAVESYERALQDSDKDLVAERNLGMVLVKLGNYDSAIKHLEKAIKEFDDFESNFYLAESYRANDKFADAIFHYQKALRLKPDDLKTLRALSWSYFKVNFFSEALATAQTASKKNPNDAQTAILLARTLLKLKKYDRALKVLQGLKEPGENSAYVLGVQGDIYLAMGQGQRAQELYTRALKDKPMQAGALLGLSKLNLLKRDYKTAITHVETAIHLRPHLTESYLVAAQAYENVDLKKALKYLKEFYKRAGTDPEFLNALPETKAKIDAMRRTLAVSTIGTNNAPANGNTAPRP